MVAERISIVGEDEDVEIRDVSLLRDGLHDLDDRVIHRCNRLQPTAVLLLQGPHPALGQLRPFTDPFGLFGDIRLIEGEALRQHRVGELVSVRRSRLRGPVRCLGREHHHHRHLWRAGGDVCHHTIGEHRGLIPLAAGSRCHRRDTRRSRLLE